MTRRKASALSLVCLVSLWEIVARLGVVDPLFLSPFSSAVASLGSSILDGSIVAAVEHTTFRTIAGFVLATAVGVPLGLLLGSAPVAERYLGTVVDALRSLPATAIFPLFLLFLGSGDASRIGVVWFGCVWSLSLYTAHGVRSAGTVRRRLLVLHGASAREFILQGVFLPALPTIVAGMRVMLSVSLVVTIAIEMVVGTHYGLGQSIFDAQNTFRTPEMYGAIIVCALVGVAMNACFVSLIRVVAPWVEGADEAPRT